MIKKAIINFTCLLFLLVSPGAFAQEEIDANKELARQLLEIGDEIYQQQKAAEIAKEQYIAAAQADPENVRANYMAGKLITETINKQEAIPYFLKVYELNPNFRFDILYAIGRAYQYGLEFEKAVEYYHLYLEKLKKESNYRGSDKVPGNQVERRIYESENGLEYVQNARNFSIVNISAVNSGSLDYAPVINADENMMIFTSRRREGNLNENVFDDNFPYEDIFISRKVNGEWTPAENIGSTVNTLYFESSLALSADGQQLYIYRDDNNGDIYVSDIKRDGTWSVAQPLSKNINSSYSENSVSVSHDGQTLYFSSNRPGGHGGMDLYKCEKDRRGVWGKVTSLGDVVNTPFDEDGVFMDYDGKTLYFSSRGHKGMGGYDIYKSVFNKETGNWSPPVNLGYPINTPDDDIFFVSTKDGKRGYFATVRNAGMGYLDIYMAEISDISDNVSQKAARKKSEKDTVKTRKDSNEIEVNAPQSTALQPVQLLLEVEDSQSGRAISSKVIMQRISDGRLQTPQQSKQGVYKFDLADEQAGEYILSVESSGYMFKSMKIKVPAASAETQELRKKIALAKVAQGNRMILEFIYFDFNKATLKRGSDAELGRIKSFLENNPGARVEIAGHTDNQGPKDFNKDLSQRRAQAIVDYLIRQGIDQSRLTAHGYGEEEPLASNDDEQDGRELNRRVELRVVSTKQQTGK